MLGWRWCRHDLECYLLEPRLVEAATGWIEADYSKELIKAAQQINSYTAARWTIGIARRSLPPLNELTTRPITLGNEIQIPPDCSASACSEWALRHVETFRTQIEGTLDPSTVQSSLTNRAAQLASLTTTDEVLVWHSGKDLMAALGPLIAKRREANPKAFRKSLADWVKTQPEQAIAFFPEWKALMDKLTAA
ncbi:hypothetical protein ACN28S_37615 [Cystobacter fuscus]